MKFGYLDKFDRNEFAVSDFHPQLHNLNRQIYGPHRLPENEYQAMMEAMPHEDYLMTAEEREQDWNIFEQKIVDAKLTAREELVVNCIVYGGMSLAKTAIIVAQAEGLSKAPDKMSISRCRDKAFDKLREALRKDDSYAV